MVAAVFSLSALLWAFSSPFWARMSDRYGRKPLMMVGLAGFMVSMALCAVVVAAGLHQLAAPVVIFILFLLARALFGLFGAASNPATQAYVAEYTPEAQRTQSISGLAGAFSLGTVIGPFIAPLFILPVLGLAGPMACFAVIAGVMLVIVWRRLPESVYWPLTSPGKSPQSEPGVRGRPMWLDPRLTPFLIYGFIVAVSQTAQGQTLGFLIIDKLGVSPTVAQGFIAIAMMFGAMAGLLAQWGLIPRFAMTPRQLLRGLPPLGLALHDAKDLHNVRVEARVRGAHHSLRLLDQQRHNVNVQLALVERGRARHLHGNAHALEARGEDDAEAPKHWRD
jgi:MFS family permease